MIGQTISHFEILDKIGGGGMGVVYLAEDTRLKRPVALKFLPPHLSSDPDAKERFVVEARSASALNHPNICAVFDVGATDDGRTFIAMAHYEGQTLAQKLAEGPLAIDEIVAIAVQIADGLAAAHDKGIVHRDIKPANILITDRGHAIILDFGLAKLTGSLDLTKSGATVGTAFYMSPEQLRGETIDHRTDVWSLAVVLYEMLTGSRPFDGEYEHAISYAILSGEPESLRKTRPDVPAALAEIVQHGLEKDVEHRCASMSSMLDALRSLGDEAPASRHSPRRDFWRLSAGLTATALIVLAVIWVPRWLPSGDGASETHQPRSLAVLPFDNRSGDESEDYFSDGLTDQLTTTLARIGALKVIARTSASRYRGTSLGPSQIGEELGVEALVTGSVLRSGGRVRITAELISTDTQANLWADSYERDEQDVLALQGDVARAITDAIALRLTPDESARITAAPRVDPEAFEEYLKGRSRWERRTAESVREGLQHFQNATRIAPDFALGYAGLADSYIILGVYGFEPPYEAFPAAKVAAEHALELDPGAGEPYASLGDILFHYEWDWEASDSALRKAIELAPGFATAYHWGSEVLVLKGDMEGALDRIRRARSLDPLSMIIRASLGRTLWLAGRPDEALAELQNALVIDPRFRNTRSELARLLVSDGRVEEALVESRRVVAANPDYIPGVAVLGFCLGTAGRDDEALDVLQRLDEISLVQYVPAFDRARITATLGDVESTLRYLQRAVEAREGLLPLIADAGEFAFLQSEPRFEAILQRIGIPSGRFLNAGMPDGAPNNGPAR
jgi:serine/threonine protein kinase/tetratricopeptide (TPR) repeat protein